MDWNIFAWVSSALFLICFVPQIWKTIRLKKVDDISPWMWYILGGAHLSGLVFSLGTWQPPLMANYGPGLIITSAFLVCYYKYRGK